MITFFDCVETLVTPANGILRLPVYGIFSVLLTSLGSFLSLGFLFSKECSGKIRLYREFGIPFPKIYVGNFGWLGT